MSVIDPTATDLFAGTGRKELAAIEALCTPLHVKAGQTITRQGTYAHECVVIIEGTINVERDGTTLAVAGPGEMIGELALLDSHHTKRTATATAVSDCRLLVFSATDFNRLIAEHPTVATRINAVAVHRLLTDLDRQP